MSNLQTSDLWTAFEAGTAIKISANQKLEAAWHTLLRHLISHDILSYDITSRTFAAAASHPHSFSCGGCLEGEPPQEKELEWLLTKGYPTFKASHTLRGFLPVLDRSLDIDVALDTNLLLNMFQGISAGNTLKPVHSIGNRESLDPHLSPSIVMS